MSNLRIPTLMLVMALAVALAACADSTSNTEAESEDAVAATTTSATTTAEQPRSTTAEPASESRSAEIAAAFMAARDRYDADAMMALLSPDAAILDNGFWPRKPEEYRGLTEWWEIIDNRWTVEGCEELEPGPPAFVRCTHSIENAWSKAQGADPVPGSHEFLIEDDVIVEVTHDVPDLGRILGPWVEWLERFHPADIPVLLRFDERDRFTGGPSTTPEALALYRQHIAEYVAWEHDND